jgi:GNAT superfamily N-acetyltransferase
VADGDLACGKATAAARPELLRIMHQVSDIKTAEDLNLPVPALVEREDGKRAPRTVVVSQSDEFADYLTTLVSRADDVRAGMVEPHEDNMLKITHNGRSAALDLRLVPPTADEILDVLTGYEVVDDEDTARLLAGKLATLWAGNRPDRFDPDATVWATGEIIDEDGRPVLAGVTLTDGEKAALLAIRSIDASAPFQRYMAEQLTGGLGIVRIKALAVRPSMRRHGVGAALLQRCRQLYAHCGYLTVYGQMPPTDGLDDFYRRHGFDVLQQGAGFDPGVVFGVHADIHPEPHERIFITDEPPRSRPAPLRADRPDPRPAGVTFRPWRQRRSVPPAGMRAGRVASSWSSTAWTSCRGPPAAPCSCRTGCSGSRTASSTWTMRGPAAGCTRSCCARPAGATTCAPGSTAACCSTCGPA